MGFISNQMDFFSVLLRSIKRSGLLIILFLLIASTQTFATHLRAGNIIVQRSNNGCSQTVTVTILVYTKDTGSPSDVLFGGDGAVLDFGDGSTIEVGYQPNEMIDASKQIARASFTATHTYAGAGRFTISYREPNRNGGVLNMYDSEHTEFYLETTLDLTFCNQPPILSVEPIDRGCRGVAWFHNPGAYDPEGVDSLRYQFVIPFQDRGTPVIDYKNPDNKDLYHGIRYDTANEAHNGKPSFKINPRDGTITWDAPGDIGEYNIAFVIIEYKKINGTWREVTRIRRDMQILIEDCNDKRPDLIVPQDTCIEAGTILKAKIIGFDQDASPSKVKLEGFSEIFERSPSFIPAKLLLNGNPYKNTYEGPASLADPLEVDFEWTPECERVRAQRYQVVFKVTEQTQQALAAFKTWFIKVVGPAPKWKDIDIVPSSNVNLQWKNYLCKSAADSMEIWRRVDSVSFKPNNCETGMPALGYEMIAKVPIKDASGTEFTSYLDTNHGKGLAPGAMYCYRLVAKYPKGGESYVSKDTCIGPIITSAPIITNVTVDTTDVAEGEITIKWHEPLLPPTTSYTYEVYRGNGFDGPRAATPIATGLTTTSLTDKLLNTKTNIYNYQIVALDNGVRVDTSAAASSVRLESTSQIKKISLQWKADVPWSILSQDYPIHKIYRGPAGSFAISQMEPIDEVNVIADGLVYIDSGQYNNTPLVDGVDYCYIVETRGTYGNDVDVAAPLINFSQAICTQTGDSIPPCKMLPPLRSTLDYIDCEDYFEKFGCRSQSFRNIITWNAPEDAECREDVYGYKIYSAPSADGIYLEIPGAGIIQDTVYIDSLQTSFARCYKIAAVDRSGNLGALSDPVCFDNCPFYELPNVFTPNGDKCNDVFSAFSDRDFQNEEGDECTTPLESKRKCPRFVQSVNFKVFNRWGKEVYTFQGRNGDEKNTIYIDWDGRDNSGIELSSGVYYYIAEVTFNVVEPSEKVKIFKGWMHLVK
jgi:hypothetical protein